SDLGIDVGSVDGEIRSLGDQIADVAEEGLVGGKVEKLPRARAMPIVDLRLQRIALCEKIAVPWRQVVHDAVEVSPERRSGYARAGQSLVDDELVESLGDPQAPDDNSLGHGCSRLTIGPRLLSHCTTRRQLAQGP